MKGHGPSEGQTQDSLLGRLRPVPVLTGTSLDRPRAAVGVGGARWVAHLGSGIYSTVSLEGVGTGLQVASGFLKCLTRERTQSSLSVVRGLCRLCPSEACVGRFSSFIGYRFAYLCFHLTGYNLYFDLKDNRL